MRSKQYRPYVRAGVTAFIVIAAAIIFFFAAFNFEKIIQILSKTKFILRPIFMGIVLAFLLLPVHRHILSFLQKYFLKMSNNPPKGRFLEAVSIVLSLSFAFFVIYVLIHMAVPQVYTSVVTLVNTVPEYITKAKNMIMNFLEDNPEIQSMVVSYYNAAAEALEDWLSSEIAPNLESVGSTLEWLKSTVFPNITGVVSNVSAIFIQFLLLLKDILLAVIVSVYLLARKDTFAAECKKIVYSIFSPKHGDLIIEEARSAYRVMSGFINGKLLDSLIIGIITLICCNLFHFPYPALVAAIIGVTNIIPFFGPFIGAIPCALLILMTSPLQCLYFVIFIIILQQFDGNILGPKILGESMGLASFWILFSIILFGGLFGFAGMVLGVPTFAILYNLIRRIVNIGLNRHKLPIDTSSYIGITKQLAPLTSTDESKTEEK